MQHRGRGFGEEEADVERVKKSAVIAPQIKVYFGEQFFLSKAPSLNLYLLKNREIGSLRIITSNFTHLNLILSHTASRVALRSAATV
jgi:hypothetical protein